MPPKIEANKVAKNIYIGSYPHEFEKGGLKALGIDALVLSAIEDQAPFFFSDVDVYRVPLKDDSVFGLSAGEFESLLKAAHWSADHVKKGHKVLITCHMGINRSAFTTAVTIKLLHPDLSGEQILSHIQSHRRPSFLNPAFRTQFVHWADTGSFT
jgi:protein-tyrosine phosphatase